ncbi:MAG: helix-turn-helix domain-containing protein [Deltaproteobacteria bacterium]|nr:helix-turn-helix domain-containing protein [Deltaproteobacteria bacterium]
MKSAKKKKLEKPGWSSGDASDLLGLSPEEMAIIEMKIALAKKFQELRKSKKMTQVQVAKLLHTSQSKVAKMEAGDPSVSLELLIKGLITLGSTRKTVGRCIAA